MLEQLGALNRRLRKERMAEGWTETEGGLMIAPGWVRAAPDGETGDSPE